MFRFCRRCCTNKYRDIKSITLNEMKQLLKTEENVTLVDVRSKQEYNEGHLRNSINIPVYDLLKIAKSKLDYDSIIIVYCNAGTRSQKAVQILSKMGYKNLYNIREGIDIYE